MCLQGARAQRTARVQRSRQRCGACSHPPAHTAGIALLASMHTLASAALHTPASAALQDPPSGNPPFPLRGLQWYDFPTPSLWQEAERRKPESSGPPKGGSGAAGLRSAVGPNALGSRFHSHHLRSQGLSSGLSSTGRLWEARRLWAEQVDLS